MSDPLDMAPEMVPFVTGAELEAQLRREREEMDAFYRRHEEGVARDHARFLERQRLERPRR